MLVLGGGDRWIPGVCSPASVNQWAAGLSRTVSKNKLIEKDTWHWPLAYSHICMHVYTPTLTYMHACTHTLTYMYIYTHIHMHSCMYSCKSHTSMYIYRSHACMYTCILIHIYVQIQVTHIHTCIYSHSHTHMHVYTQVTYTHACIHTSHTHACAYILIRTSYSGQVLWNSAYSSS